VLNVDAVFDERGNSPEIIIALSNAPIILSLSDNLMLFFEE
jgi:hypothetical protein